MQLRFKYDQVISQQAVIVIGVIVLIVILVVNLEYFEDFVKVATAAFTAFNLFNHARNANLTKTGHANSIKKSNEGEAKDE